MPEGIADLSYRHYGGEMASPKGRWMVIARLGMKNAFKTRAYWVYTALSAYYPLLLVSFLYILEQSLNAVAAGGSGGRQAGFADRIFDQLIWGDELVNTLGASQLLIVIITMIIGAGCIANDNRSNALLVYLSRPCSRGSYLLGKWVGLFVPLLVSLSIPALSFYIYGVLNYREKGFLSDDPMMILKLAATLPLMAGFYASLMVGISSLFRQPRMASAIFFGLYILSYFFSVLMKFLALSQEREIPQRVVQVAEQASYLSISGLMQGMAKLIFQTNGSPLFGGQGPLVPRPEWWVIALPAAFLVVVPLLIAAARVRAVEVVK